MARSAWSGSAFIFNELFATRIGAFFEMDVIVSALFLGVFIWLEGCRLAIRHFWLPVIATALKESGNQLVQFGPLLP